ncbi:hypothetical protein PVL29_015773 [Vitis rotundifolia]|uniref:Trichome birefringence-like N-terminal domain-containing protein n=1 Tax=Vitis rotundifolia TaxID=103349 RepID=A0AA38ZDU4_VITRO|nr:hypothetical protein PVL29_015773 [Vitis rotundifolia]
MTHMECLKKFKRFNPLKSFVGILGFFLVAICFIGCFFFLDYRAISQRLRIRALLGRLSWAIVDVLPRFLEEGADGCNVFDGNWVRDDSYPLYQSQNCSLLDDGFHCSENSRPYSFYTKWLFVGDSIGINQWESLLCMLSSAVSNKSSIYEVNGSPITKHTGFLVFKFSDFNCTIEYYIAPFLVVQGRPPPRALENVKITLRGCYFQEENKVKMEMSVDDAYKRSLKTLLDWVINHVNMNETQKSGGSCHLETLPDMSSSPVSPETGPQLENAIDVLSEHSNEHSNNSQVMKLDLLSVTLMTSLRKDGHLSVYHRGPGLGLAPLHRQDCSHWCLPSVPNSWNELLCGSLQPT